MALIISKCICR